MPHNGRCIKTNFVRVALSIAMLLAVSTYCTAEEMVTVHTTAQRDAAGWTTPKDKDFGLRITLVFKIRHKRELDKLTASLKDPKSPYFRTGFPPAEYRRRFSPSPAETKAISDWLSSEGFEIVSNEGDLTVTGTVATAEKAFGIKIVQAPDGWFYANKTEPRIPARFAGLVELIRGLDNLRGQGHSDIPGRSPPIQSIAPNAPISHPAAPAPSRIPPISRRTERPLSQNDANAAVSVPSFVITDPNGNTSIGFSPQDFYTFYDEQPLLNNGINGGGGDCIALVEDSDYLQNSVNIFNATFGLSAITPTRVQVGGTGQTINDHERESLLDIEWAHAVAAHHSRMRVMVLANPGARTTPRPFADRESAI